MRAVWPWAGESDGDDPDETGKRVMRDERKISLVYDD